MEWEQVVRVYKGLALVARAHLERAHRGLAQEVWSHTLLAQVYMFPEHQVEAVHKRKVLEVGVHKLLEQVCSEDVCES